MVNKKILPILFIGLPKDKRIDLVQTADDNNIFIKLKDKRGTKKNEK